MNKRDPEVLAAPKSAAVDGTISTRTDPDELGDLVAPWDRFLEGDTDAFFDLNNDDQVRARLEFPLMCP